MFHMAGNDSEQPLPPLWGLGLPGLVLSRPGNQDPPPSGFLSDADLETLVLGPGATKEQIDALNAHEDSFDLNRGFVIHVQTYFHSTIVVLLQGFWSGAFKKPQEFHLGAEENPKRNVYKALCGETGSSFLAGVPKLSMDDGYRTDIWAHQFSHFIRSGENGWDWKAKEGVYGQKGNGHMQLWSETMRSLFAALKFADNRVVMTHILAALKMRDVTEMYKEDTDDTGFLYVTFPPDMDPIGKYVYKVAVDGVSPGDAFRFEVRGDSPYLTTVPPPRYRPFWTPDLIYKARKYAGDSMLSLIEEEDSSPKQEQARESLRVALHDAGQWGKYLLRSIENAEAENKIQHKELWIKAWNNLTHAALTSGFLAQRGLVLTASQEAWQQEWAVAHPSSLPS